MKVVKIYKQIFLKVLYVKAAPNIHKMNKTHTLAFIKKIDKTDLDVIIICPENSLPHLIEFLELKYESTASTKYIFTSLIQNPKNTKNMLLELSKV